MIYSVHEEFEVVSRENQFTKASCSEAAHFIYSNKSVQSTYTHKFTVTNRTCIDKSITRHYTSQIQIPKEQETFMSHNHAKMTKHTGMNKHHAHIYNTLGEVNFG